MRKRIPVYCYFLPLLLGAGAWWFVSWLTTPRPLWVRSFVIDDFAAKGSISNRVGKVFFSITQDRLRLRPFDSGFEELVDISSGRTVSRSQRKDVHDTKELQPAIIRIFFGEQTHLYDRFTVEIGGSAILSDVLPKQWEYALLKKQWLPQWMWGVRFWLHLRDRESGKILITAKVDGSNEYLLTNQWFIVIYQENVNGKWSDRVQAFEIPVTTWSPWWGPLVGLVVVIGCWMLLWSVRRSVKPVEPWRITVHEQQV